MPKISKGLDSGLNKVQILLVNGSTPVCSLLTGVLNALGFTKIFRAEDAAEAIQIMKEVRINLVIADQDLRLKRSLEENTKSDKDNFILPLGGYQFVKRLRQSPASPNPYVPVIVITSHVTESEIFHMRESGANGIIAKPLEAEQLCLSMKNIIANPRPFITAENYRGPCRRHMAKPALPKTVARDRRERDIRIIRHKDHG